MFQIQQMLNAEAVEAGLMLKGVKTVPGWRVLMVAVVLNTHSSDPTLAQTNCVPPKSEPKPINFSGDFCHEVS